MSNNNQQFTSRWGFILAAMGSAIGLGNIWRFPAVAYNNGGGAFIIPYLFALLTAGIPLLILEFSIGNKFRGSAPLSLARANKKAEWAGWWQVVIAFFITSYYSVIIAWIVSYTGYSFAQSWGADPQSFFIGEYLQLAEPGTLGGLVPNISVILFIVWALTIGVLLLGVQKGIEKIGKIFIPILFILFTIVVIYSVTLPGATLGLNTLFSPDWSKLADPKVWVAAYSQIFFSLSIGFAVMITFASYTKKGTDITTNAVITGLGNASVELLAGIGIFAALGFMATAVNLPVSEVVQAGPMLVFVAFPEVINQMPDGINTVIGFLFFFSLVLAGFSSLISIVEVVVAAISDKFNLGRTKAVLIATLPLFLFSFLYATRGGFNILDTVDYFINNYGVVIAGLVEVILVVFVFKNFKDLINHANENSQFKIGRLYEICLSVITPLVLIIMISMNFYNDLTASYSGYPVWFNIVYGWLIAGGAIVIGIILSKIKSDNYK